MEKRIQKDSWLRKIRTLAVVGVMAVVGGGSAWGQNGATITKALNNTANDATTGVHIKKEIIYVDGSRELYVPEMRISFGKAFNWYIHWYVEGDGTIEKPTSISINVQEAKDRGGDIPSGYTSYSSTSCLYTDNNNGFWWSDACNDSRYAIDASAIVYKLPQDFTSGRVICDVSNNQDWDWISTNPYNFKEPTLLKRYVYEIRPASEYVEKLKSEGPEEFIIDFPKGCSTINFTMPSLPSNYFWESTGAYKQGNKFAFSTDENDNTNKSYSEFIEKTDTIIMGWNTYHQVTTELAPGEWVYEEFTSYIFTHRELDSTEKIRFVKESPGEFIRSLKRQDGKDIWICGGADIVQQLMREDLIDRFHISVIPVILGDGIRLFGTMEKDVKLRLVKTESYNGISELIYEKQ